MHWIHLTDVGQLQQIIVRSEEKPQVIFKHCTHCGSSAAILNRLQQDYCPNHIDFHFLDQVSYGDLSSKVAETFHVADEVSEVLVIKDGECIFQESDPGVSLQAIMEHLPEAAA
jgi:bacillithiol system protein YtxJ